MKIITAFLALNSLAVFVALLAHVLVGIIWYFVFGKPARELCGNDMKIENKWLPLSLLAHTFYTIALAVIVKLAEAATVLEGLIIGVVISISFIATLLVNELAYTKMPFKLFLFKFGDELISLCAAAIILSLWK